MCQTVVDTQFDTSSDDVSLRPIDQRRVNAERLPFDARLGGQDREPLERLDEFRAAVWIARVIECIHPDEEVL